MTSPYTPGHNAISKVNWWHDAIIDWFLINPSRTLGDCAEQFNVTRPWLSRIMGSEVFKEHWRMRLAGKDIKIADAHVSLMEKVEDLAHLTLDEMTHRIEHEKEKLSHSQLLETTEVALKALGYGQAKSANAPIQNIIQINGDAIREARENIRKANTPEPILIEHDASISTSP